MDLVSAILEVGSDKRHRQWYHRLGPDADSHTITRGRHRTAVVVGLLRGGRVYTVRIQRGFVNANGRSANHVEGGDGGVTEPSLIHRATAEVEIMQAGVSVLLR